jgi:prevent-host-death family protein
MYPSNQCIFVSEVTMQKIIGVTELQRRFRSIFDEVAKEHVPYVLTRGSRPEAALIPYEEYLRFQALREQDVLARFDQLVARMAAQTVAVSEEEVAADVVAARAELAN